MKYIELENITFSYSEEEPPVLKDFSVSVEKGKCLIVEGDNGSGKTTLFRLLNGLCFPQEGHYRFDGLEITREYLKNNRNAKMFHKKIGYLFQTPDIMLFNGTVYDEIAFGPRQMGLDEKKVQIRTEDCMKLFEIEDIAQKAPYHLSGGQKKRVALASVMALNPDVVILDEPCAGLDKKSKDSLLKFLMALKASGKTLFIATHDDSVREKLADDVLMLE